MGFGNLRTVSRWCALLWLAVGLRPAPFANAASHDSRAEAPQASQVEDLGEKEKQRLQTEIPGLATAAEFGPWQICQGYKVRTVVRHYPKDAAPFVGLQDAREKMLFPCRFSEVDIVPGHGILCVPPYSSSEPPDLKYWFDIEGKRFRRDMAFTTVVATAPGAKERRFLVIDQAPEELDIEGKPVFKGHVITAAGETAMEWPRMLTSAVKKVGPYYIVRPLEDYTPQALILDENLATVGSPVTPDIVGFNIVINPHGDFGLVLAAPIPGAEDLYRFLDADDAAFGSPPGAFGVRPVAPLSDFERKQRGLTEQSFAQVMIAYDTAEGRRWGFLDHRTFQASGPLWTEIKVMPAPYLSNAGRGNYYLVGKMPNGDWQLYYGGAVPTFAKVGFDPEELVRKEEALWKSGNDWAMYKRAVEQSTAIEEQAAERARLRREALLRQWEIGSARDDFAWMAQVAPELGEDYVRRVLKHFPNLYNAQSWGADHLTDALEKAACQKRADELRIEEKRQRAQMLAEARERELERKRRIEASRSVAVAPIVSTASSSGASNTTYDRRTGVRSDTKALQDFTYGRVNWAIITRQR